MSPYNFDVQHPAISDYQQQLAKDGRLPVMGEYRAANQFMQADAQNKKTRLAIERLLKSS